MALEPALTAWRALLGHEHVSTEPDALAGAEIATFATRARVLGILRPADRDQVIEILRIATRERVPVHAVSRGKNWGLGSRVPVRDAVLVTLDRLDRILELHEDLAYVTLEPGVTFQQLRAELDSRGSRLLLSSTGGSPEGSVLANALERGDGSGPYGDRSQWLAALEVVLGNGELVHTGFHRFAGSRVAPLHRTGVGPALDGLFTQSRLGLVTRGTIWLAPKPDWLGAVRFSVLSPSKLPKMIDSLRTLKLDGTLRSIVGVWNDYRVLSTTAQRPDGVAIDREREAWGGAMWLGLGSIYAPSRAIGEATAEHVTRVLGPSVDALTLEEIPEALGESMADPGAAFLWGVPHEQSLKSAYFKKRSPPPEHPDLDRDRCGVLWLSATIPLSGSDVARATAIAEHVLGAHGFEPLLALLCVAERTAYLLPMIVYDRDQPGADARALLCHDELLQKLVTAGYPPYRLGNASMGALAAGLGGYSTLVQRIREICDPADILMPGRYEFLAR